ncbi:MAG TPA: glycosyltransferase family A protein [Candidatus Baltobacteraceae bacterium]|jgi:hypothetical protein
MGDPAVTTVIATYNRAALVTRAIRSVQAQSYENVVIAVYDNASTDETQAVVETLARDDRRIRYHRRASNVGAANNFLFALRDVATPFFHMLSDDDVIFPDFISEAVSWLERFPDARFAAGGTLEVFDNGALLFAPQAFWPRDGCYVTPDGLTHMLQGFHPSWTTVLFRRQVLEEAGEFDPALGNVVDLEYTLRVAAQYPYVVFRKPSGVFSRHSAAGGEFTSAAIVDQFEDMTQRLLALPTLDQPTKAIVESELAGMRHKRAMQVAVKELLRAQPVRAAETLRYYHQRYPRTNLSRFLSLVSAAGAVCPPLLATMRPLEALRRSVVARKSRMAARKHGVDLGPGEASAPLERAEPHASR